MCSVIVVFLLFFKQKSAYELRISDWSSDVCSSDLRRVTPPACADAGTSAHHDARPVARHAGYRAPADWLVDGSGRECRSVRPSESCAAGGQLAPRIADRKSVVRERVCQYV